MTDKLVEKLYHVNWGDGDNTYIFAPSKQEALDKMTDGKGMVNYVVELNNVQAYIRQAVSEEIKRELEKTYLAPNAWDIEGVRKWYTFWERRGIK